MKTHEYICMYVEVVYNDYENKQFTLDIAETMPYEEIVKKIKKEIFKWENQDSTYYVEVYKIYKILNKEYEKFAHTNYTYNNEKDYFNFPVFVCKIMETTIETPNQNIPVKYKLEKEIYKQIETGLVNNNGIICYDKILKIMNKLEKMISLR